MTLQELIELEDKASEVWVISPSLHYDTEHKDFSEIVSVNLGEKTKYRYIVPCTQEIEEHLELYKKKYSVTEEDIRNNFLILPPTEFIPFITECAIYNATTDCIACAAPAVENLTEVLRFTADSAKEMADHFANLWRKYKRTDP